MNKEKIFDFIKQIYERLTTYTTEKSKAILSKKNTPKREQVKKFDINSPSINRNNRNKKFIIQEERTLPTPCCKTNHDSGSNFRVAATTRPKACPLCLSQNDINKNVITKHENNSWKCLTCGHTWR